MRAVGVLLAALLSATMFASTDGSKAMSLRGQHTLQAAAVASTGTPKSVLKKLVKKLRKSPTQLNAGRLVHALQNGVITHDVVLDNPEIVATVFKGSTVRDDGRVQLSPAAAALKRFLPAAALEEMTFVHGVKSMETPPLIVKSGFRAGGGDMYGRGIYFWKDDAEGNQLVQDYEGMVGALHGKVYGASTQDPGAIGGLTWIVQPPTKFFYSTNPLFMFPERVEDFGDDS